MANTLSSSVINLQTISDSDSFDSRSEFEQFDDFAKYDNADTTASAYQEGWIISYVDILTLLLTLFVILLAMSHFKSEITPTQQVDQQISVSNTQRQELAQTSTAFSPASPTTNAISEKKADKPEVPQTASITEEQLALPKEYTNSIEAPITTQNSTDTHMSSDTETKLANTDISEQTLLPTMTNQYLKIDTSALFYNPVDITKILPVETDVTDMTETVGDEYQDIAESETNSTTIAVQETAITSIPSELVQQIENSELLNQIEINEIKGRVNIVISDQVLFAPGKVNMKTEGLELLQQLAAIINNTQLNISVEGHTDNVPISNAHYPSNWELSTARATMVTRHLIENNIPPQRIRAIGYADTQPRENNETSEGRERNRRVSIILHMPEKNTQEQANEIAPIIEAQR